MIRATPECVGKLVATTRGWGHCNIIEGDIGRIIEIRDFIDIQEIVTQMVESHDTFYFQPGDLRGYNGD